MKNLHIVSGMPHSSTRLVYDLLKSSGIFSTPDDSVLNSVKELPMLHAFLTASANSTPISESMLLSEEDIKFIFSSYIDVCSGNDNFLIKMPYYPVVFSSVFIGAARRMGMKPTFVIVDRDIGNIRSSYVNRNEDLKYSQPGEMLSQINRLPIDIKRKSFISKGYLSVLDYQYEAFLNGLNSIQDKIVVKTSDLSVLDSYVSGFGDGYVNFGMVDEKRLKHNSMDFVKNLVRKFERRVLEYRIKSY